MAGTDDVICKWESNKTATIDKAIGSDQGDWWTYVGRFKFSNATIPGKTSYNLDGMWVAFQGEEHFKSDFEVLISDDVSKFEWVPASDGELPTGAIEGGFSETNVSLFVARFLYYGTFVNGYVNTEEGLCYGSYGYKVHTRKAYEVLACKSFKPSE